MTFSRMLHQSLAKLPYISIKKIVCNTSEETSGATLPALRLSLFLFSLCENGVSFKGSASSGGYFVIGDCDTYFPLMYIDTQNGDPLQKWRDGWPCDCKVGM